MLANASVRRANRPHEQRPVELSLHARASKERCIQRESVPRARTYTLLVFEQEWPHSHSLGHAPGRGVRGAPQQPHNSALFAQGQSCSIGRPWCCLIAPDHSTPPPTGLKMGCAHCTSHTHACAHTSPLAPPHCNSRAAMGRARRKLMGLKKMQKQQALNTQKANNKMYVCACIGVSCHPPHQKV